MNFCWVVFFLTCGTLHCYTALASPFWFNRNAPVPVKTNDIPSDFYDRSDQVMYFESDTNNVSPTKESRLGLPSEPFKRILLPLFVKRILSIFELKRVVRELETSRVSAISCYMCRFGIGLLKLVMSVGFNKDEVVEIAELLCIDLELESDRVCKGIVNAFKDEVFYVCEKSTLTVKEMCGLFIGDACGGAAFPDLNWNITIPPIPKPPVKPIPQPQSEAPKLQVLHLSDTHYDAFYKEGANAECGEPLCCREGDAPKWNTSVAAGKWGDYRKCDPPLRTIENMFDFISKNFKFDYILWTGDLPPHDVWNQTREDQINAIRQTTQLFLKYFPDIPIFPAIGNHESAPVDSFPPPFIKGNNSISWLYDELSISWAKWLPNYTIPDVKKGAFYSVLVSPGFRIISLNINYCNNKNWWLLLNTTDPAEELQWLVYELQHAELKKEKVHIIGHIPPGMDDCMKRWSYNYYKIINRYESTIIAQFFGHTHLDEFEIFYDEINAKRPVSIAYVGPSVTPYVGLNPAFRIYTIDGLYKNSTYAVLDHENYMMDLGKANQQGSPTWKKLYSAKEAYKMNSLQPKDWDKLVQQLINDDLLFQKFYTNCHRDSSAYPSCDQKCKYHLICALISGRSHDPHQCSPLRKLIFKS